MNNHDRKLEHRKQRLLTASDNALAESQRHFQTANVPLPAGQPPYERRVSWRRQTKRIPRRHKLWNCIG